MIEVLIVIEKIDLIFSAALQTIASPVQLKLRFGFASVMMISATRL